MPIGRTCWGAACVLTLALGAGGCGRECSCAEEVRRALQAERLSAAQERHRQIQEAMDVLVTRLSVEHDPGTREVLTAELDFWKGKLDAEADRLDTLRGRPPGSSRAKAPPM